MNMNTSSISVRYAKALYQVAAGSKISEQVLDDLIFLDTCFRDFPEFEIFVNSPIIKSGDKLKFFRKVASEGFQDLTLRFIELLIKSKRENFFRSMVRNYKHFYRKDQGVVEALLLTASDLNDSTRQLVYNAIKGAFTQTIDMHEKTDPELIGGFILRVEDKQLDASVASHLKLIKRKLDQTLLS